MDKSPRAYLRILNVLRTLRGAIWDTLALLHGKVFESIIRIVVLRGDQRMRLSCWSGVSSVRLRSRDNLDNILPEIIMQLSKNDV
jgi:hypothetical protein